jgi:hypothetical protein
VLLQHIGQYWQPRQLVTGVTCPTLGTHTGPGVLSVTVSQV